MPRGANLSAQQISSAVAYNRNRLTTVVLTIFRTALGTYPLGPADEAFARLVADWQEDNIKPGEGDGKFGPKTEAYLGVTHPKALAAVASAHNIQKAGNTLFDDWGNDVRDNDNDGTADGSKEKGFSDGAHFGRVYTNFGVVKGMYTGLGWDSDRTLTIASSRTITGTFRYLVCADIVSRAYSEAGVMKQVRSTAQILDSFRNKGYVWRRSEGFPKEYLPGDFICTLGHGGGHSGIVVERSSTRFVPKVIELPGPSTAVDLGSYNPASTNDVRLGSWTKASVTDPGVNYLGRLLMTKLGV